MKSMIRVSASRSGAAETIARRAFVLDEGLPNLSQSVR